MSSYGFSPEILFGSTSIIPNKINFDAVHNHPELVAGALVVGAGLTSPLWLPILGFTSAGVAAGSIAAGVQGSSVAAGSYFAILQSAGALGGFGTSAIVGAGSVATVATEAVKTTYEYFEPKINDA